MAIWISVNIGSQHQVIPWTNVDLSLVMPNDIYLRPFPREIPQLSITEISLKITYLNISVKFPKG